MAKTDKELSNDEIWAEIKKLEDQIVELKSTLKPATLPKQADLNECNRLARKANVTPNKVNPAKLSEESGRKVR